MQFFFNIDIKKKSMHILFLRSCLYINILYVIKYYCFQLLAIPLINFFSKMDCREFRSGPYEVKPRLNACVREYFIYSSLFQFVLISIRPFRFESVRTPRYARYAPRTRRVHEFRTRNVPNRTLT